jgi:2,3-bisphosphoglycerate-independent phosphoglycerate mutase
MLAKQLTFGGFALGKAVRELYQSGQTDYSLEPVVLTDKQGNPLGRIRDGDGVIFCCRRGEREVQLTEAFTEAGFDRFPRKPLRDLNFVTLTLYHEKFKDLPVAFAPTQITSTLAEVISQAGLRQLHTAESEKFAHVTFFFNGGNGQPFGGEEDIRIPSPRDIPFDQVPELSLARVTEQVLAGITKRYDFIVTNFANGDVIGHTSNNSAKIQCASFVDFHLGQVVRAALASDYVVFVTADHGNLEEMLSLDGTPHVAHTLNPVKFILLDPRSSATEKLRDGKLADVAPTILSALNLASPSVMDGRSLAPDQDWGGRRRVLFLILDGWGIGRYDISNPIFLAGTPFWDRLLQRHPSSCLQASGEAVGLQPGKTGNSEAGHLNLGAGRVILQDDVRLELAMKDGTFAANEILSHTIEETRSRGTNLHLLCLLSERSSHGSIDYPLAILQMAKERNLANVYLHVILDGRSTEPGSAPALLEKLERQMQEIGIGQIVSGVGRGIALDRDGNYSRTRRAYEAFVDGKGKPFVLNKEG